MATLRLREKVASTSSLVGRDTWGRLLDPEVAIHVFPNYAEGMAEIVRHREALKAVDIAGKFNTHVAGFSPSGNQRLAFEFPTAEVYLCALAAYGRDVFSNKRKRALFAQEHPEYTMTIRR